MLLGAVSEFFIIDKLLKAWYNEHGNSFAVAQRVLRSAVTFSIMFEEVEIFFSFLNIEGGDIMDYITWQDLLAIAMLIFAIISCFNKKK